MILAMEQFIYKLARWSALFGGAVLCLLAVLTLVSVIGREDTDLYGVPLLGQLLQWLDLPPVPGDFEIVEAGTALVVCLFMPWAQLMRGHASVAILTDLMGKLANRIIDFLSDFLLLGVALIITWRHIYGLLDKLAYGETTFILRFPLWWGYALALAGMLIWVLVAFWCSANSARLVFAKPDHKNPSTNLDSGAAS